MKHFTNFLITLFLLFSYQSFGQYCMPTANCTDGDGILEFGVGSFVNTSACEADNGIAGYGDFTALTGLDMPQGAPTSVSLQSGFDSQQMSIWIDIDNSLSFDSTELILADFPVGTELVTADIIVPNIPLGSYQLRVQSNYNDPSSPDACSILSTFGETEDYTVNIVSPASCFSVSSIMTTDVGVNNANVSWTENGMATAWDVEFVEAGNTATGMPSPGFDNVTNPVILTGLSPITTYQVFVRADCGADNVDVSVWSSSSTFTTECNALTPDYSQDFSVLTGDAIPDCWSEGQGGDFATGPATLGTSIWFEDGFANDGFAGALKMNLYQGGVANDWLISPIMDLSSGGPFQVEFDFSITTFANQTAQNLGSDDQVAFLISTDNGGSWTALQTWTAADNVNPLGEKIIHNLTPFDGMSVTFALWGSDGTVDDLEDNDIFIDNFTVRVPPSCVEVTSVSAGGVTSSSAEISWIENGSSTNWDLEFVETGMAPTGVPSAGFDDISNPVTITGLTPVTTYDVYVRPDCGMDNASDLGVWTGPNSFTTLCTSFVPTYYEDFGTLSPNVPDCWDEGEDGSFATGPALFGTGAWLADGFANNGTTGAMKINLYLGNVTSDWLISPVMDLSTGGPYQAEFDFSITAFANQTAQNLGSDDTVAFLISTDFGSSWTAIQTWTVADNVNPLGEKIIHDLSTFGGMEVVFAFYGSDGTVDDDEDNDIFIDNFYVRVPPTCPDISAISAGNLTSTSVDISWTENGSATTWDIEFGETGFAPTGTPSAGFDDVTTNPASITGLMPVTTYDVYVRPDCAMDNTTDVGVWMGPISFETDCAVFAVPYLTDFTDLFNGDCWQQANDGVITEGPQDFGASSWFADGFANDGFTGAAKINLFTTGKRDWLISPDLDLTGGPYQSEFDFSINTFGTPDAGTLGSDDRVAFLVSSDNMATWSVLRTWDANSVVNPMGEHIIVDLSSFAGMTVNFAFWGTEGTVDDDPDNDIFVDNFAVNLLPAAPLVATTNVISITCNGDADGAVDLVVTGGVSPFTFIWSNGETTEDLMNVPAGNYTVTITDADNSTLEFSTSVSQPPALSIIATSTDESLDGATDGSIDLAVGGGIAGYTFLWDNGATTEDLSDIADGTYCVTVTDANNCTQETCAEVMAGPVSIKNIEDLESFKVYPNPVGNESIWIELEFSEKKDLNIQIVNTLGQEVFQTNNYQILDLKTEVNVSQFSNGIYFIKINSLNENQTLTYRLVKQ